MRERGVQIESWGPFAEGEKNVFTNPTLTAIGEAHGKSVGQVVLRWLTQRQVVVIPKSVRPERMAENLDIFDFELTDEQVAQIATLDTGASLLFDQRDPEMVTWLNSRGLSPFPPLGPARSRHPEPQQGVTMHTRELGRPPTALLATPATRPTLASALPRNVKQLSHKMLQLT